MTTPPAPIGTSWTVTGRPDQVARSLSYIVLVGLGIGLLWMAAPIVGLGLMGDCGYPPSAECEAFREATGTQARVFFGILMAHSLVGVLAIIVGGRRLPGALLLVSIVTLALAWASVALPQEPGSVLPVFLAAVVPGALLIALGSTWQLVRRPRPRSPVPDSG